MAKTNTEQPANKAEQKKQVTAAVPKSKQVPQAPVVKSKGKKVEVKSEIKETPTPRGVPQTAESRGKKEEKKKVVPKVKKPTAVVNGKSVPVSTKQAIAICKFIKHKKIKKAIEDLEEVSKLKKAVPMKGEIPHRKGSIMSGRFPVRASKEFIMLLVSLTGNANQNEIDEPIITGAMANQASRPFGKMGRVRKKRSHVQITCTEKSQIKKLKEKKKTKGDKK
ncbi:hypothetical protein HOD29_03205 [archaeon]|jgi:ribosomal protein L22|nr:hypothetical protein [archaeon]